MVKVSKFVIQLKDENWFGEFVDLREGQEIPDRSVVNVIPQVNKSGSHIWLSSFFYEV